MVFPAPGRTLGTDDLLDAYPWPAEGRWVRAMMVTSLDGAAAGPDGLSGSISSTVDGEVFEAVRRLADVVLVGAGTLRAEEYGPMCATGADVERRAAAGQATAPRLAVVSGSLRLPWGLPVWSGSTLTPLVLTGRGLHRIVGEGGPSLLEAVVAADLLDEADITISPVFAGTATTPRTPGLQRVTRYDLVHLLTTESFLMGRYVRPARA